MCTNILIKIITSYSIICRDGDLPLIVAIDLQPMAPIEGVIQVQGDITNARTAEMVSIVIILQFFVMLQIISVQTFRLMPVQNCINRSLLLPPPFTGYKTF